MKAAFILSVSLGYWVGFCAFLRSLELYGHKEDVIVFLYGDVPIDKIDRLKAAYPDVQVELLSNIRKSNPVDVNPRGIRGWDCRFYQYWFVAEYLDYDVYCFWCGDALLLNNISKYLTIGERNTVLSNHFNYFKTRKFFGSEIDVDGCTPLADIPFITSNKKLLRKVWEKGDDVKNTGRGNMRCIYNALCSLGMLDEVFVVSNSQWVGHQRTYSLNPIQADGEGGYYLPDGVRINSVHGPLWKEGFVLQRSKTGGFLYGNYELFRQVYLDKGREI